MRHNYPSRRTDLLSQNFLWVGYWAWQGYLNSDRGIIAVSSEVDLLDDTDGLWEDLSSLNLNFRYIPQLQLATYLQEWLVPSNAIDPILTAVADYHPETELIFALESNPNLDIGWCQRLKISPPDCYQQIWRRWSEFELGAKD
jgi:hypothetical protein